MKEKIAEMLKDIEVDLRRKRGVSEAYERKADQILSYQREEIEKGLLTNEEIRFLRDAANVQENKLLLGNTTILSERAVAQAQLQKILALLK